MGLPKYGSRRADMPVLDARAASDPWSRLPQGVAPNPPLDDEAPLPRAHEASAAERARTVVANSRQGVVGVTLGDPPVGVGFNVSFAVNDKGGALIGVREGTREASRVRAGLQVSLAVAETPLTASQVGAAGGVTMIGTLSAVATSDPDSEAMALYTRTQPADSAAVKRGAGYLFALNPSVVLVTVPSGAVVSVDLDEYRSASSDPLAAVAPGLVSHLGSDQGGTLVLLCRAFGGHPGAGTAELASVDQYGMDLLVGTAHGRESVRLPFSHPVSTPEEVRKELSVMARAARFKLGVG